MSQKIAAIEGNSFSGKTTTVESLEDTFGIPVIHEYDRYAGGGLNFPSFPPDNVGEAKKAIDFFVRLEVRRSQHALELAEKSALPVVMDRSPFSCIVFQKAVQDTMPNLPNAYAYSIEAFQKAICDGEIVLPGAMIYLEPQDEATFEKRVRERGRVHIDFLNETRTFRLMQSWYTNLVKDVYGIDSGIILKSLEENIDLTTLFAFEFVMKARYKENGIDLIARLEP